MDAGTVNNIVQTVALIGAGLWAVYTFVYQSEIAPRQAPPSLSVSSLLEKAGQQGDVTAIRCVLTRSNVGQSPVRLLGLTYNVIGIKEAFLRDGNSNPAFGLSSPEGPVVSQTRYYGQVVNQQVIVKNATLFAGAHAEGSVSELNPGESLSRDGVFYADRAQFDRVRLKVRLVYQKADDPGTPLVLETDAEGMIIPVIAEHCRARGSSCAPVYTTDFSSELSLW